MNLPIQWTPERIVKQHQAARPNATLGRELPRLDACLKKWVAQKTRTPQAKRYFYALRLSDGLKARLPN